MADSSFEVCTARNLPNDLADMIKSGQVADAKKLFDDCMPQRALGITNAQQPGDATKNQVRSMQAAAQIVGDVSDDVREQVALRLGKKAGEKTGLED